MGFKLNDNELTVISSSLKYTKDKKKELKMFLNNIGDFSIEVDEFTEELSKIRKPLLEKEFKSEFIDSILLERLDTFNPTRHFEKVDEKVLISKYHFMLDLNVRMLQDLELEALKGNLVH